MPKMQDNEFKSFFKRIIIEFPNLGYRKYYHSNYRGILYLHYNLCRWKLLYNTFRCNCCQVLANRHKIISHYKLFTYYTSSVKICNGNRWNQGITIGINWYQDNKSYNQVSLRNGNCRGETYTAFLNRKQLDTV